MAATLWKNRVVSGCYRLCLFITQQSNCGQWYWYMCIYRATQQSNCGQWDWYMCIYRATQQSNCGQWDWYTGVYLPCNTAEQLWTVGLVHMCVFTVQHSRATVDSGTGTCVYLPCNTEQLWTVGLVHVYLLCSTAEQLWTVVLVHMCVFSMQHRNCGQWYWYTRVYLSIPCNTATVSDTDTRVYLLCNRAALDSLLVNGASIL